MAYPPVSGVVTDSIEIAAFLADRRLARLAQHLVDLVDVRLFLRDEVPRVLLERNGFTRDELEQLVVEPERVVLRLERLAQNLADVVRMRLEQVADPEGRMPAEARNHLAGLLRMPQRLGRLILEPLDDRNAAVAEDHHRVVRVADDARELALEDEVQLFDDLLGIERHR